MPGALIPEGPLHPEEFVLALIAGALAAVFARRHPRRWVAAVLIAAGCVMVQRQGAALVDGYLDHRHGVAAAVATLLAAVIGSGVRPRPAADTAAAVVVACAGVWMIVPDTEAPLIGGVVVAAALAGVPRPLTVSRMTGLLAVVPVIAAVVGSAGRPDRLAPALLVATAVMVAGWLTEVIARGQRAGTPTTVAPSATSSTTTAPAPTTAF